MAQIHQIHTNSELTRKELAGDSGGQAVLRTHPISLGHYFATYSPPTKYIWTTWGKEACKMQLSGLHPKRLNQNLDLWIYIFKQVASLISYEYTLHLRLEVSLLGWNKRGRCDTRGYFCIRFQGPYPGVKVTYPRKLLPVENKVAGSLAWGCQERLWGCKSWTLLVIGKHLEGEMGIIGQYRKLLWSIAEESLFSNTQKHPEIPRNKIQPYWYLLQSTCERLFLFPNVSLTTGNLTQLCFLEFHQV